MALELVVSPFLGLLFDNLTSLIQKEVGLLWGVDKEMKKLASTLSTIQAVIEDAEEKQLTNKAIVNWLRKLKDAAYLADDILDEWATESMQLESTIRHETCNKQVCDSFLSCFNFEQIKFRRKIAKRINELRERFDEIASERSNFHFREWGVEREVELYQNRETSSIITESQVFGRGEEKEYIVGLLLGNVNIQEDLSICPIVGIGGLGKTTVAKLVYNDDRVEVHFDVRIWVFVSQDFDVKRLTKDVIVSITRSACFIEQLDTLQRCLEEKLAGKRFLLVLDDVWNENQEQWNRFKYSFRCGAKGSSIIVTTRLETVASITGTCRPYFLKFLSEDDCWSLFRQRAFGMGNQESPNLVKIGKEILKKCGGVPLAANVLGGLMRFKVEHEWLSIRDNGIWNLPPTKENTILPALKLSYTHLSPRLRQCFAYCSIFPKDYRMQREEIIHLWMTNCLFQSKEEIQLEDIGNEIFNALLWRSFFQDVWKDENDKIESFMMHDLVHDLACSITMNECSNLDEGSQITNVSEGTRHLSVSFKTTLSSSIFQSIHQSAPNLRTLIVLNQSLWVPHTDLIIPTFKSLRAMSLHSVGVTTLPDSVHNLKHLRYLNLSYGNITSLPESICRLTNLQTLILMLCSHLQTLPESMRNMSSLRHLDIRKCNELSHMPIQMGELTSLQTLSIFIVGSDDGRHIKELQGLDHLSGELTIKGLEHVRSSKDAKGANLMRKQSLHSLGLAWSDSHLQEENDRDVMEGLQPHRNMKNLYIKGYGGLTFPSWLGVSSLPKLVVISLYSCTRCEHLPSLGRLPLLKTFNMGEMHSVKFFNGDNDMVNGFPSLEELFLFKMPKLEEWCSLIVRSGGSEEQVIRLPSLKKLTILKCPRLKRLPFSPFLEFLHVEDSNAMVLGSVKDLPRLSSLSIHNLSELIYCPEGMLKNVAALQSLSIMACNKLKTLPRELGNLSALKSLKLTFCKELATLPEELRNLTSLKSIDVQDCHDLKSLPEVGRSSLTTLRIWNCCSLTNLPQGLNYLTTLQSLDINNCPKLEISTVDFQHLVALRTLLISRLPDLACLPDGIQHVSSTLQSLTIRECSALISLPDWIGSLTKLRDLYISYCKNLTVLPDGLQHLTNLQSLEIFDCHPELHRRCEKERGDDWQKIAHIPRLIISEDSGV